jgi:hypothetical protein
VKPWLTKEEVAELTARVRPSAQLRQLKAMGFDHLVKFRTDGSFVVMREGLLNAGTKGEQPKEYELDFSEFGKKRPEGGR